MEKRGGEEMERGMEKGMVKRQRREGWRRETEKGKGRSDGKG